jgi:hypothetical protein
MKVTLIIRDREYAELMALENNGICTPRELFTDALLMKMREARNLKKNTKN